MVSQMAKASSSVAPPTAAVLLIGNELLSGKVQDANLVLLARDLRALGVRLVRVVMVEDDVEIIAQEVRILASAHDWLFTSGGVGPTHDDVTLAAVAQAFALKMQQSGELTALLKGFYGDRCTEGHLRMAVVPDGTELVSEMEGDDSDVVHIDGKRTPWPAILVRNVFVLPGIPQVFQMKLSAVRARLRKTHPHAVAYLSLSVFTDMDEGHLKHLLDAVVAQFTDVEVGSYPAWYGASYRTKLTFDGRDHARVQAASDAFCATLPEGEPKSRS
ncbi:MAG: molybdopterin-binding protein [Polyangiales bacterium]